MTRINGQALETARAEQRATAAFVENRKLLAKLEYLAMMDDIDIDTDEESQNEQNV